MSIKILVTVSKDNTCVATDALSELEISIVNFDRLEDDGAMCPKCGADLIYIEANLDGTLSCNKCDENFTCEEAVDGVEDDESDVWDDYASRGFPMTEPR